MQTARSVLLHDPVYGECAIQEAFLIDLLESAALSRLRKIHQAGASYLVRPARGGTRFAHSVGVCLLIRRVGGSVEEQAAGLVHDVSHTAFSHVIDYALGLHNEDYHEQDVVAVIAGGDLPEAAARHGQVIEQLLDGARWPLLEQKAPDLCADRIDYALRDLLSLGWIEPRDVRAFLNALIVVDQRIVVSDVDAAEWFAFAFARLSKEIFLDPTETYANRELASAIRIALSRGLLTLRDLAGVDDDVMAILNTTDRSEIKSHLSKLTPKLRVVEDQQRFEYHVRSKPRFVDPIVKTEHDVLIRLSELRPALLHAIEDIRQRSEQGLYIRAA